MIATTEPWEWKLYNINSAIILVQAQEWGKSQDSPQWYWWTLCLELFKAAPIHTTPTKESGLDWIRMLHELGKLCLIDLWYSILKGQRTCPSVWGEKWTHRASKTHPTLCQSQLKARFDPELSKPRHTTLSSTKVLKILSTGQRNISTKYTHHTVPSFPAGTHTSLLLSRRFSLHLWLFTWKKWSTGLMAKRQKEERPFGSHLGKHFQGSANLSCSGEDTLDLIFRTAESPKFLLVGTGVVGIQHFWKVIQWVLAVSYPNLVLGTRT